MKKNIFNTAEKLLHGRQPRFRIVRKVKIALDILRKWKQTKDVQQYNENLLNIMLCNPHISAFYKRFWKVSDVRSVIKQDVTTFPYTRTCASNSSKAQVLKAVELFMLKSMSFLWSTLGLAPRCSVPSSNLILILETWRTWLVLYVRWFWLDLTTRRSVPLGIL